MNRLQIKLRSAARKAGLHHWLWKFRDRLRLHQDYEQRCHRALERAVRSGDVVWDIGANEGFYTELFCRWVGPQGRVVAIEPNPQAIAITRNRLERYPQASFENLALGSCEETAVLAVQTGSTVGFLHYDPNVHRPELKEIPVKVTTGDKLSERLQTAPNVLKIDVEGFEEDVLSGLEKTLSSPSARVILIEVHFQLLESRGQAIAPVRMEKSLEKKGYRVKWVDRNHLLAQRPD